jgi:hypothetical protein
MSGSLVSRRRLLIDAYAWTLEMADASNLLVEGNASMAWLPSLSAEIEAQLTLEPDGHVTVEKIRRVATLISDAAGAGAVARSRLLLEAAGLLGEVQAALEMRFQKLGPSKASQPSSAARQLCDEDYMWTVEMADAIDLLRDESAGTVSLPPLSVELQARITIELEGHTLIGEMRLVAALIANAGGATGVERAKLLATAIELLGEVQAGIQTKLGELNPPEGAA